MAIEIKPFFAEAMGVREAGQIWLNEAKTVYLYKSPDPPGGDGELHFVSPITGDVKLSDLLGSTDYAGRFEQATLPTVLQITNGKWGWWWDTVNSKLYIVRNREGTMYGVETTSFGP